MNDINEEELASKTRDILLNRVPFDDPCRVAHPNFSIHTAQHFQKSADSGH